jgi:hypothetical protein
VSAVSLEGSKRTLAIAECFTLARDLHEWSDARGRSQRARCATTRGTKPKITKTDAMQLQAMSAARKGLMINLLPP